MTTEHRCLFCDHVFVGARRKFCLECLPHYGSVHAKVYAAKYQLLYRACGLHPASGFPTSPVPYMKKPSPPKVPTPPAEWDCIECGARVVGRGTRTGKYCSGRCRRAHVRHGHRCSAPSTPVPAPIFPVRVIEPGYFIGSGTARQYVPALVACAVCGDPFRRHGGNRRTCSDACRAAALKDKDRRQNVRRRGAVQGTPYTLRMIADRDQCKCHLCGKAVDMNLAGPHPQSPSIDHLLPLSSGGLDCLTNVALSHLSCNVKRGTGGVTQLRLVG